MGALEGFGTNEQKTPNIFGIEPILYYLCTIIV